MTSETFWNIAYFASVLAAWAFFAGWLYRMKWTAERRDEREGTVPYTNVFWIITAVFLLGIFVRHNW